MINRKGYEDKVSLELACTKRPGHPPDRNVKVIAETKSLSVIISRYILLNNRARHLQHPPPLIYLMGISTENRVRH